MLGREKIQVLLLLNICVSRNTTAKNVQACTNWEFTVNFASTLPPLFQLVVFHHHPGKELDVRVGCGSLTK